MSSSRPARAGAGFTLIELMVYMALLAIMLALSSRAIFNSTTASRRLRRQADDLSWALQAVDTLKDDVRSSGRAWLEGAGRTLVLAQPGAGRTVRYEVDGAALLRRVTVAGQDAVRRSPFKVKAAAFAVEGRCVNLTLELPPARPRGKRWRVLSVSAARRCATPKEAKP